MKTIEYYEKEFYDKFPFTEINYRKIPMWGKYEVPFPSEVNEYIFKLLLPNILNNIIPNILKTSEDNDYIEGYNDCIYDIQEYIEKMGINLPE